MPKNIILLSDGTGNSSKALFKTNVWRLYQALDLSASDQIAYYDDGVGTSSFAPLALLGGAFGWGLKRNIIDLYTFLCRHYEKDDSIYCFGFSRGAFTIRVLVALINHQGIVPSQRDGELKAIGVKAFRALRRAHFQSVFKLEVIGRAIRDAMLDIRDRITGRVLPALPGSKPDIAFLGLWDSVAAYGLPIDELTRAWDAVFPLSAPDRDLSPIVKRACHALALDDERNSFHPVLWNEKHLPEKEKNATRICDERISQVWFAGAHSNVGGGYPDDGLAHVSLAWIMEQAGLVGLRFKKEALDRVRETANPHAKLYDPRHAVGSLYRYMPRNMEVLLNDTYNEKNEVVIAKPKIHVSVFQRIAQGTNGYAPLVLPRHYAVVTGEGKIVDPAYIDLSQEDEKQLPIREHQNQAEDRVHQQEKIWNLVWFRRIAYFTSILVVTALLAFPLYRIPTAACEDRFCALAPIVNGIGMFLPDLLVPWKEAFRSHPGSLGFIALALVALRWIGKRLQIKVSDEMRDLWKVNGEAGYKEVPVRPRPSDKIFRFRTHGAYQMFFNIMKRNILPTVFGIVAGVVLLGVVSKGLFSLMNSAGFVCQSSGSSPSEGSNALNSAKFPIESVCWDSGIKLEKGQRYRISLKMANGTGWYDAGKKIGVGGMFSDEWPITMYGRFLIRRHMGDLWFTPIARIGSLGSDEYPLYPLDKSIPNPDTKELIAEITARRSGELFLYLNEAVLPMPESWQYFYRQHKGTALVSVQPLHLETVRTASSSSYFSQ